MRRVKIARAEESAQRLGIRGCEARHACRPARSL